MPVNTRPSPTTTTGQNKCVQTAVFGAPEYEPQCRGVYRPRISPKHLSRLWIEKRRTKKPMSKIVAEALDLYFEHEEGG
jgi:hypothetical protein